MKQLEQEAPVVQEEKRWTPWLWQLAAAGAGFVLAGGGLFGAVYPLGLALVLGVGQGYLTAAALGAAAGSMVLLPHTAAIRILGAMAAGYAGRRLLRGSYWAAAGAQAAALALVQLLVGLYLQSSLAEWFSALGTAAAAAALGLGFTRWQPHTNAGACFWLCCLAASAQRLAAGLLQPGLMLLALCGAALCWRGSPEQTAVQTLAMAGCIALSDPAACYPALVLAAAAVAGRYFGEGQRLSAIGVFAAIGAFGAAATGGLLSAAGLALAVAVGVAGVFFLPVDRLELQETMPAATAKTALVGAAAQIAGVAAALRDVTETVGRISARREDGQESYNWVIDYTAREVCRRCPARERCWNEGYSSTVDGFYRLRAVLEKTRSPTPEQLPAQFDGCGRREALCTAAGQGYELLCSRRSARVMADTLRKVLGEQYSTVAGSLDTLAARLSRSAAPEPGKAARLEKLFSALGLEPLSCTVQRGPDGRLSASVVLARMRFSDNELAELAQEVGLLCRRPMDIPCMRHCRTVTSLTFAESPALRPEFGLYSYAARDVCGDVVQQFCDGEGHAQMLLCDGMGVGKPAAVDGTLAAQLTGRLLQAGFDAPACARLVNVALAIKGPEESGATLDLLTVDLHTGAASLFKAGAAPSFLIRGGRVRQLGGAGLPIGILDRVVGQSDSLSLQPGDYLVLISDGVLADGPEWVRHQLALCAGRGQTAQQMARSLADGARQRAGRDSHPDDITVAVCCLTLSPY